MSPQFINGRPHKSDETRLKEKINSIGAAIHGFLNEEPGSEAHIGFFLLVFPINEKQEVNQFQFITNGASNEDVVQLMKNHIAAFERGIAGDPL